MALSFSGKGKEGSKDWRLSYSMPCKQYREAGGGRATNQPLSFFLLLALLLPISTFSSSL